MGDFGAYHDDVRFGWAEAGDLAAELRSTAAVLDDQIADRHAIKQAAREAWRGRFAEQFDGRVGICAGDASRIAAAMRDAASKLDELARLAREEQERREYAREWEKNNDDGGFGDWLHDVAFGEDDLPPPPPPVEPPSIPIIDPQVASR
jgi:hypothetical protein